MSFNPLVSIDGYALPNPAPTDGYTVNVATIVDSGRNLEGRVTGAVIRDDVIKISLSWNYLTAAQWSDILALFTPTFGGNFYRNVTFYNPTSNSYDTRLMYVSDRNAGMWLMNHESGACRGWAGSKLSLIEV
ncbi:MAG: hypothetical protein J6S85_13770 [Methanobrevibacter sp.]|nr:hypothetical protein [Methanobrevibacter sp.]